MSARAIEGEWQEGREEGQSARDGFWTCEMFKVWGSKLGVEMVPGFSDSQRERNRNAADSRVGVVVAAAAVVVVVEEEEEEEEEEAVLLLHASSKNDKHATAASSRSLRT